MTERRLIIFVFFFFLAPKLCAHRRKKDFWERKKNQKIHSYSFWLIFWIEFVAKVIKFDCVLVCVFVSYFIVYTLILNIFSKMNTCKIQPVLMLLFMGFRWSLSSTRHALMIDVNFLSDVKLYKQSTAAFFFLVFFYYSFINFISFLWRKKCKSWPTSLTLKSMINDSDLLHFTATDGKRFSIENILIKYVC